MKNKFILTIVTLAIALLLIFFIIQIRHTSRVAFEFYGAEMMWDGTVIVDGKITFSGTLYEEKEQIKFKEMELPGSEVILPETDGFVIYSNLSEDYILIHGQLRFPTEEYIDRFNLYLSNDSDWCVIWMDEANRLFVGSIHEDFNASKILEKVSRHLK